ncbi:unnamed protein product [Anisakis simplex]|uniref:Retrotransposon hot spot (RHS) protein n=1 Tax=Anisakis simplex TaxID=6269 RepID=A0A0M3K7C3_ANISI|nr:unnamed protein product [Anisakis simplex]
MVYRGILAFSHARHRMDLLQTRASFGAPVGAGATHQKKQMGKRTTQKTYSSYPNQCHAVVFGASTGGIDCPWCRPNDDRNSKEDNEQTGYGDNVWIGIWKKKRWPKMKQHGDSRNVAVQWRFKEALQPWFRWTIKERADIREGTCGAMDVWREAVTGRWQTLIDVFGQHFIETKRIYSPTRGRKQERTNRQPTGSGQNHEDLQPMVSGECGQRSTDEAALWMAGFIFLLCGHHCEGLTEAGAAGLFTEMKGNGRWSGHRSLNSSRLLLKSPTVDGDCRRKAAVFAVYETKDGARRGSRHCSPGDKPSIVVRKEGGGLESPESKGEGCAGGGCPLKDRADERSEHGYGGDGFRRDRLLMGQQQPIREKCTGVGRLSCVGSSGDPSWCRAGIEVIPFCVEPDVIQPRCPVAAGGVRR